MAGTIVREMPPWDKAGMEREGISETLGNKANGKEEEDGCKGMKAVCQVAPLSHGPN